MSSGFFDTFLTVITIFLILLALVLLIAYYINYQVTKLPENTPEVYIHRKSTYLKKRTIVMCIGDSLTHGRISTDYVRILRRQFGTNYEFINAGINSNLAWNVSQRLEIIIQCHPDFITILIGSNDANAVLSHENRKGYVKRMKLPQDPDLAWYKASLNKIIARLKQETKAEIAILTLPLIGESPESKFFLHIEKYNEIIRKTAENHKISCLPLQDLMLDYLLENPACPKFTYEKGMKFMVWSAIQHYVLFRSWETISEKAGFELHLDYLHLNIRGATMIADLIEGFIESRTDR